MNRFLSFLQRWNALTLFYIYDQTNKHDVELMLDVSKTKQLYERIMFWCFVKFKSISWNFSFERRINSVFSIDQNESWRSKTLKIVNLNSESDFDSRTNLTSSKISIFLSLITYLILIRFYWLLMRWNALE